MPDLQRRVVNVLTAPRAEWPLISLERTNALKLTLGYVAVLAAIPAASVFIGLSVVGINTVMGTTVRVDMTHGLATAVAQYALSIGAVHVAALVVDRLAPTFRTRPNALQALKLVTYASTAVWVAGVFNIIPALAPLAFVAGLYSLYLFYLGMVPMMGTPGDQVVPYMSVAAVIVIVLMYLAGALAGLLTAWL